MKIVGYINAHGTSTYYNDKNETAAHKNCIWRKSRKACCEFYQINDRTSSWCCRCNRSNNMFIGNRRRVLPPTINYKTPDPECDLNYIPNIGKNADIQYALSNSLGFGGHNATLVLKKYEGV